MESTITVSELLTGLLGYYVFGGIFFVAIAEKRKRAQAIALHAKILFKAVVFVIVLYLIAST